jgi:hypothetical protein
MSCPKCQSSQTKKNGFRRGKQCHLCKDCAYQFVENPTPQGYHPAVKELCLKMVIAQLGEKRDKRGSKATRIDSIADKPCLFPVLIIERISANKFFPQSERNPFVALFHTDNP